MGYSQNQTSFHAVAWRVIQSRQQCYLRQLPSSLIPATASVSQWLILSTDSEHVFKVQESQHLYDEWYLNRGFFWNDETEHADNFLGVLTIGTRSKGEVAALVKSHTEKVKQKIHVFGICL